MSQRGHEHDLGRQAGSAIAFAFAVLIHAMVGFLYLSSGLFAPGWAVLVLLLAWTAFAYLIWRWRRRGIVVLAIPFAAVALLLLAATAGDQLLGWTA